MKTVMNLAVLGFLFAASALADVAETYPFLAVMQPSDETPPINDTSVGNAIIWVHVIRDNAGNVVSGSVDFDIACRFSSAVTVTGLHIHNAAAGVAGSIVVPTDVNSSSNSIAIDATGRSRVLKQVQFPQTTPAVAVSTISDLLANPHNYYANIHTTDHPGGAMRGQLMRAEMKVLMGMMSPQNEVPPQGINASGIATVTALRALDGSGNLVAAEAIFNLDYTGFDSSTVFTGFHIHGGPAGVNAGVIINTGIGSGAASVPADASGAGNLNYPVPMTSLDPTFAAEAGAVNGLFTNPNNYYINIHTTTAPGGIMRDQMKATEKAVFQISMLPANETPPISGLAATGLASIPVYLLRNADGSIAAGTVVFDINFRGFPAGTTITGLHIHQAASGVSGGIVIPGGVDNLANKVITDSGNGNIFKVITVSSSTAIAALNQLVQNPGGFYANLHTSANPGGAIRAQLGGPLGTPSVGGVAATSSTILQAAPGSILSIYGSNLAGFSSDLGGVPQLKTLPLTFNGVSATIAGAKAPFYFVSPGQLNVQVPFEVAAGQQPLIVTTAGGASTSVNINVAAAAPSIFLLDAGTSQGAILRNDNFSVVSSTNKVKAGDTILVYSTGLGQTTPPVQTGVLVTPPAGGFNNTAAVTVSIGGQNANVAASIASPNFAGLYQTAVTVPNGVSGNVPLILKVGNTSSNTVTLPVQ